MLGCGGAEGVLSTGIRTDGLVSPSLVNPHMEGTQKLGWRQPRGPCSVHPFSGWDSSLQENCGLLRKTTVRMEVPGKGEGRGGEEEIVGDRGGAERASGDWTRPWGQGEAWLSRILQGTRQGPKATWISAMGLSRCSTPWCPLGFAWPRCSISRLQLTRRPCLLLRVPGNGCQGTAAMLGSSPHCVVTHGCPMVSASPSLRLGFLVCETQMRHLRGFKGDQTGSPWKFSAQCLVSRKCLTKVAFIPAQVRGETRP